MIQTQTLEDWLVPLPIPQEVQRMAQQFANEQPTQTKAQQVYFNTLAVGSVNNYLRILGIPTNLSAGNSWNPVIRLAQDTADLRVTGLGDLECRPVKEGDLTCHIPQEAWFDKIGYVAVEINKECTQATLLGFSPTAGIGELPLKQLRSLKDFPAYLNQLRPVVQLSQWFEDIFEVGWQTVEKILATEPTELAFRGATAATVQRCKLIELGRQEQTVAIIVTLAPESEQELNITVEAHPIKGQSHLPPNLQMMFLDEEGEALINAQSKNESKSIQLQVSAELGDRFSVKVALGDVSIIENFWL